ncbi:5-(carboxyamino)imidazole ribonucleotide synthase [Limibaculum sp. M0105]|uniref:N5-carboxyaminoimidazole ribonucleotide synthase n=1 Tax=Thermohalobaculum xanthum TaxID=2753746 RepID=A0A8J7MAY6_9RHOB|nr:5-(carboxyamino)imidazole ribonucleotide synthase [Thermohalobaculum xanthum]MBK0400764.1 5-(carboxyamino)imidazole ribonucleotide synthase [Thermohalobaculum xanthum]
MRERKPKASTPLKPGSTIGILGGGQLGRMLAIAAARLGFRVHVFEPSASPPAGDVAADVTCAAYDDTAALRQFASGCDVVTCEFENVPAKAAETLALSTVMRPSPGALEIAQDRVTEKRFLHNLGVATAPWAEVDSKADLLGALGRTGAPAILKTRRLGYDGKGQARVSGPADVDAAWHRIGGQPAIMEGFVPFTAELSVIAARGVSGEVVCFDPGSNVHRDGILHQTTVPSGLPKGALQDAVLVAGRILNALDYVGVMGVEMFYLAGKPVIVNEIAPRVHNSGHWTIEACVVDQFEQHIRAVAGWPLGDGQRHSDAVMTNLIGDEIDDWPRLAAEGGGLHIYGKAETRPGRKMGHVTRIGPRR